MAFASSSRVRSRLTRASSTPASAERSIASSTDVSWRTSTSPALTALPASKATWTILPSSSAATVTPWTAESDPTDVSASGQLSSRASAVDTDSGGGAKFACCRATIWRHLTTPMSTKDQQQAEGAEYDLH